MLLSALLRECLYLFVCLYVTNPISTFYVLLETSKVILLPFKKGIAQGKCRFSVERTRGSFELFKPFQTSPHVLLSNDVNQAQVIAN